MPEGPEVRIISEGLNKLSGLDITYFEIDDELKHKNLEYLLKVIPCKIISVKSHAKKILFHLKYENKDILLISELRMTGSWTKKQSDYSKLCFHLSDKTKIYFNDVRNFGSIELYDYDCLEEYKSRFGHDVLKSALGEEVISHKKWIKIFRKHNNKNIQTVMLDGNKAISGIGLYLFVDILYLANISPFIKIKELSDIALIRLYTAAHKIILHSYKMGGFSFSDFINFDGEKGKYESFVYGRKEDQFGDKIIKEKHKGRSIYYIKKQIED